MTIKLERGCLVWCFAPYQKVPKAAMVLEDHGSDGLYAFHFGYGHEVYLVREDTYPSRETAVACVQAKREARDASDEAMARRIVDDMIAARRGLL